MNGDNIDLISVIVPVYNLEKHIENTVKSIREQTYHNLEIIVVDDGSFDATSQIIDRIAQEDSRVKVIHKENGGVTRARFRGIEVATGEWIGFVDGDDYIEPEMFEVLLNNAYKYDADISHCGYQMVFPNRIDYYYNTGRLVLQDNATGLYDLLQGSFVEPGLCNKLFNKTLLHSLLHKMNLDIKINEDLLMNFYLFKEANKSVFLDKSFYHYQVRSNSAATSSVNENKLNDPLKVLKILDRETQQQEKLNLTIKKRIIAQLINLATISCSNKITLVKPYRDSARSELRKMLPKILKGNFSVKQKIMALWVAVFPASYRFVHNIYFKFTGLDKKYDV